jgi:hypothetical protein
MCYWVLGLPCADGRVQRHPDLTTQRRILFTQNSHCDIHFFSYLNNTSVCLSVHMVCEAYICRRQGINYDMPSYLLTYFLPYPTLHFTPPSYCGFQSLQAPYPLFWCRCLPGCVCWLTFRPVTCHLCSRCLHISVSYWDHIRISIFLLILILFSFP